VPALADLFSEIPLVADISALGAGRFLLLSEVPVIVAVDCLGAMQVHRTALLG
jgi:hypothetical protein